MSDFDADLALVEAAAVSLAVAGHERYAEAVRRLAARVPVLVGERDDALGALDALTGSGDDTSGVCWSVPALPRRERGRALAESPDEPRLCSDKAGFHDRHDWRHPDDLDVRIECPGVSERPAATVAIGQVTRQVAAVAGMPATQMGDEPRRGTPSVLDRLNQIGAVTGATVIPEPELPAATVEPPLAAGEHIWWGVERQPGHWTTRGAWRGPDGEQLARTWAAEHGDLPVVWRRGFADWQSAAWRSASWTAATVEVPAQDEACGTCGGTGKRLHQGRGNGDYFYIPCPACTTPASTAPGSTAGPA